MLSNYPEYSPKRDSYPPHASSNPGQYLGATQSSNSSCDSDESQHGKSSGAASQDEMWFDFTLYYSDESATGTEPMSVVETSESVQAGSNDGTLAFPPLEMLPELVTESMGDGVTDDTALYRWLNSTDIHIQGPAAGLGSAENTPRYDPVPVPGLSIGDHPESPFGTNSTNSLPSDSSSPQNDTPIKVAVPRMRHYICHTCKFHSASRSRLGEHLQQYHQPARFTCGKCHRSFQAEKDLLRHAPIHEISRPVFACSCNKSYTRLDSLQRHIKTEMAKKGTNTGVHKPV